MRGSRDGRTSSSPIRKARTLSGDALGVFFLSRQRRAVVEILVEKVLQSAAILFDGSDLMPGAFGDTWGFALQKIAQNPSTSNIKNVLKGFQSQIKGQWGK